jgi:hypothetical protein
VNKHNLLAVVRRVTSAVRYRIFRSRRRNQPWTVRPQTVGRPSTRSAGGTEGRPDLTPCPGCHGHVSHYGDCIYRTIPIADITSVTMSSPELKRLLDRRLAQEDPRGTTEQP